MSELTTPERAEAILRKIVELCNDNRTIGFEDDMGGDSLTIIVRHENSIGHTHVGCPGESFDMLVENLYNALHGGPGLSWA